jgi:hypothetical protein
MNASELERHTARRARLFGLAVAAVGALCLGLGLLAGDWLLAPCGGSALYVGLLILAGDG